MEDILVKEVVERLNCSSKEAYLLLHQHDWNIQMVIVEASKALDHRVDDTADFLLVNKYKKRNFIGNDTTSSFPDIVKETEMFFKVVEDDIIENSMRRCLEESKHLNWWIPSIGAAHKLFPISTTGDGNCLLHAVSLAMFGVTDRLAILRNLLFEFCNTNPVMEAIQRRWRLILAQCNAQTNLILSDAEWRKEWALVTSAPTLEKVRYPDSRYIGLEDIHIFILAHVINRPIVVLAQEYIRNAKNECLAPSNFAGLYIPFECCIENVSKYPIILGFHNGHFAPLVYMDTIINNLENISYLLPTMDYSGASLPLKFFIDPGVSFNYRTIIPHNMLATSKDDYSKVIRNYFNISNFESSVENEDHLLELDDAKQTKSILQLDLLKNIKKSVLKLKKPKGISLHPHIGSSDFIVIIIKHPENFDKILESYRSVASSRHIASLSDECRKYPDEESTKNFNRERDYGFGIGKSRFYREADFESYKAIRNIPRSSTPRDKTLYLARSTFFNDTEKLSNCEKLQEISSSTDDDCQEFFNFDDSIPFVDDINEVVEMEFPKLRFDHIILPYSVIKTLNFSDRRPVAKIAAEIADAISPKLNFVKFC